VGSSSFPESHTRPNSDELIVKLDYPLVVLNLGIIVALLHYSITIRSTEDPRERRAWGDGSVLSILPMTLQSAQTQEIRNLFIGWYESYTDRKMVEEPEIAIVGTKGQIVIPRRIRDDLGIKPKTRLALYRVGDKIVATKLRIQPLVEDLKELLREVDEGRMDRKRPTEREILEEIQAYRRERRKTQGA
jgi:AbrB family looped-hinge helix DNA binding protein